MTTDPHNTALQYAHKGWRVIPILPGTKRPALNQWQDAATTSTAQINQWWKGSQSSCGVGIATGKASGIWVLDIDDRDALYELEREHGELPATLTSITGSGGEHQIYLSGRQMGAPSTTVPAGSHPASMSVEKAGRSSHHQPSTPTATPTNGTNNATPSPPHPNGCWTSSATKTHHTTTQPTSSITATDRPGDLWANQTDWAHILIPDGWQLSHTDNNGERYWVRPGKELRDGISATTGNTHNDNLHVFTSSVPNLKAEETYTKIGYLAAIHHNHDHAAAARALAAQGFTTPPPDLNILNHLTTTSSVTAAKIPTRSPHTSSTGKPSGPQTTPKQNGYSNPSSPKAEPTQSTQEPKSAKASSHSQPAQPSQQANHSYANPKPNHNTFSMWIMR
jgi:hypothetical protein